MTPTEDSNASVSSKAREKLGGTADIPAGRSSGSRLAFWVFTASVSIALLVLAIRVGWYHHAGLMPDMVLDDSYISFRYARNLVRGHGLVYNVGERVEGYSNFLWTLAVAGAMAGGVDPEPTTEMLAALAAVGTILLLAVLARLLIVGPLAAPARFLPPLLFAAIESQGRHVVSGLETLLFVLLILGGFACLFRDRWRSSNPTASQSYDSLSSGNALRAGVLFGLAALTRPEGVLYAGIGALYSLWNGFRTAPAGTSPVRRARPALLFGAAVTTLFLPHLGWRWSYYGYPLPNTYYAKVSGALPQRLERGWESLSRGMEDWDVWPVLVLALLALPSVRRERFWAWSYGLAVVTWAVFVLVGGDHVHSFGPRLLMPALPFVLLLAAEGLRRTAASWPGLARRRWAGGALVGLIVLALSVHAQWRPWPTRAGRLGGLATNHHIWRVTGEWFARETPPQSLIATTAAGILPFVADRPTVDMFGLTDEFIAHHAEVDPNMPPAHGKSDPVYTLRRRPDYLHVIHLTPEGIPETAGLGWVSGRIAEEYELVAQVKLGRGGRVRGRWVIETNRFRRGLHRRGYTTGIFRRIEGPDGEPRLTGGVPATEGGLPARAPPAQLHPQQDRHRPQGRREHDPRQHVHRDPGHPVE